YILIHWFNDRSETAGNLQPYLTSTVTTKYIGYLYDGTEFDTSADNTDGTFTTPVSGVISGWQIALQNMHVGDTVQILVPYASAYGAQSSGVIQPYSALRFNMRLTDIADYEVKP
ncbi:MAG: FKBP-type peptidyl-prolyl cis-trans isomerase, partial [Muribaculaceae bacterium]|nr:FKBP-type peptidyl-prolyl cis-trans isomerase [Muribaculaceae bacterium]